MRKSAIIPVAAMLFCAGTFAGAGEVGFSAKPRAVREGGKVKISFAVSAPTDVEVAILDGKGKVVRHLAAGLLGKNAPSPFKEGALKQDVFWDGKGNYGGSVKGARVRVRLGMKTGKAKAIDVRPYFFRKAKSKRFAPTNKPAPIPNAEIKGVRGLQRATFGSTTGYITGAYLIRFGARPHGDANTGHIYYTPPNDSDHWEKWICVDPEKDGEEMYSTVPQFPYATGAIAFGSDDSVHLFPWGWATWRLNREWKPLPFSGLKHPGMRKPKRNSQEIDASGYGDGMGPTATCLGLDGRIYSFIAHPKSGYARLHVWGRDGKLEKGGFIPFTRARHVSNILVDRQGFLYVTLNGLPEGYKAPKELTPDFVKSYVGTIVKLKIKDRWTGELDPKAGTVPADPKKKAAGLVLDSGQVTWSRPGLWGSAIGGRGSVIKLLPTKKLFVANVEEAIPGISWTPPSDICSCSRLRMDMDHFGRLYVPDPALSRVRVIDSNGNDIAVVSKKIGDLLVAWPFHVASAGDAFAFYDGVNFRMVYVKLHFSATETVALP